MIGSYHRLPLPRAASTHFLQQPSGRNLPVGNKLRCNLVQESLRKSCSLDILKEAARAPKTGRVFHLSELQDLVRHGLEIAIAPLEAEDAARQEPIRPLL